MWHHFIALPLVTKIIGLIAVAGLAIFGWLKGKAIATATSVVSRTVRDRFWNYVRRNVQVETKQGARPNERTYRGVFRGCFQYENWPREHYFEVDDGGTIVKVPIMRTNLLSGVAPGKTVAIDTMVGANYYAEIVQRVRIVG